VAVVVLATAIMVTPLGAQQDTRDSTRTSNSVPEAAGMAFSFLPRAYALAPTEGVGHRVLILYAIPARRLGHYDPDSQSYPARVRLSRIDPPADTVVVSDSIKSLVPMDSGLDQYAVGLEELTFHPGRYDLRLYLGTEDGRIGLEANLPSVEVENLAQAQVWLSDLVLGRGGSGVAWLRDGDIVYVNPLNTYRQGTSIEVYYEVVGLPEGMAFETSISLTPVLAYNPVVEEKIDPLVSFGYDEVARSRFTPLRRTLSLGDFPPGRYRLSVAARTSDGHEVTRSTTIRVLAP